MTLFLVRHGRTASNAGGLLLGRADPPLDEVGTVQAAALAGLVPEPRLVVSSPLRRCVDTAATFGGEVLVDDRWIELDYGDWDQQPIDGVPADAWARWRADLDFRPPGGETLRELGARVRAACAELVSTATDGDVVVVTHVSPLKAALAWALDVGDELAWRLHVTPASVSRVAVRSTGPVLLSFNETSHL